MKKLILLIIILFITSNLAYAQDAQNLYKQGMSYLLKAKNISKQEDLNKQEVKEAIKIFRQITTSYPGTKWAEISQNQIAWIYYKGKLYSDAVLEFNDLIESYPDSDSAVDWQFTIGKINYDDKNYALAIIQFEKVINIFSPLPASIKKNKVTEAQLMIPKCRLEQGNYSQAINGFQSFISDNPKSYLTKEALTGISECYYRQANDYYENNDLINAIVNLDNAIKFYKENKEKYILVNDVFPNVYLFKAEILIQQGAKEKAKTILEELIKEFGMSPVSEQAKTKLKEL